MSDDLDFDMEVVETESVKDSSSGTDRKTSSPGVELGSKETKTPSAKLWYSIPEDWEMTPANEAYDVNPTYYDADGEVDYIEMDALKTDLSDPKYVGRRDPSEYSGQMFAEGDTLFAQITPCTENGKAALVPELRTEIGIGSTEFIVLSPDETKVLPRYLYYLSKSHPVHDYAVSRMRGSTGRQRVPVEVFRKELQIPLPPLPEQRKIASVLYAVDQAIQKTEAIIEQAQRVKRGLMQDFFHRGLQEANDYQSTKYGPAPAHWEIKPISDLATQVQAGGTPDTDREEFYGGEIPWIRTGELRQKRIRDPEKSITEAGFENSTARFFPQGTVLVAMYGATAGESAMLDVEATSNQACCGVITDEEKILPEFLFQQLLYLKENLIALGAGSGQQNISKGIVENFQVLVPQIDEQAEIATVLRKWDKKMNIGEKASEQLKRLKKGLMQDLLTGEVRTADKAIEVLDEVKAD